jgi:hypothetical protein
MICWDYQGYGTRTMNLYVGTSGFSYKEWKGTFYPKRRNMIHIM